MCNVRTMNVGWGRMKDKPGVNIRPHLSKASRRLPGFYRLIWRTNRCQLYKCLQNKYTRKKDLRFNPGKTVCWGIVWDVQQVDDQRLPRISFHSHWHSHRKRKKGWLRKTWITKVKEDIKTWNLHDDQLKDWSG